MKEHQTSAVDFQADARFHVALRVSNLERSVSFYQEVFGQAPSKLKSDYAKFEPAVPSVNFTLNLTNQKLNKGGALSHLGIQLRDTRQLEEIQQRLEQAGLVSSEEKQTSCCYALQDKFWLKDPDGNELEFFVVLARDAAPEIKVQAACCT